MAKRPRLSSSSTTAGSDSEPDQTCKRGRADSYDVCRATAAYAQQRPGEQSRQHYEDLREQIGLKRTQAAKVANRAAKESDSKIRSHYEGVGQELTAEAEALEAELLRFASDRCAAVAEDDSEMRGEDEDEAQLQPSDHLVARREEFKRASALLSARISQLERSGNGSDPLIRRLRRVVKHRQGLATSVDSSVRLDILEAKTECALEEVDPDMACRLIQTLVSWIATPCTCTQTDATGTAASYQVMVETQKRVRHALIRLLRSLDLTDPATRQLVLAPCSCIVWLVAHFENRGVNVADMRHAKQWRKLRLLAASVCEPVRDAGCCPRL